MCVCVFVLCIYGVRVSWVDGWVCVWNDDGMMEAGVVRGERQAEKQDTGLTHGGDIHHFPLCLLRCCVERAAACCGARKKGTNKRIEAACLIVCLGGCCTCLSLS